MTAEPDGTACAVRVIWGWLPGVAWRFALRHPRLLLLVRFADALVCSALQHEKM
jgi:hypothetical protein